MADIRIRKNKSKPYQVRFSDPATASGFAYKSFRTMKEARHFEAMQLINETERTPSQKRTRIDKAVSKWLDICEKIGRDGREVVEPQTLLEYARRGKVICEYSWTKSLHELKPSDVIDFRTWLIENKSRDLARRVLSSFHSVILEMKMQGYLDTDPAAGITIKSSGRYEDKEVQIPSDVEMRDLFGAVDALATSRHSQKREAWRRFRPMFYLAGFSGMRPSEYRGLPWKDVGDQIITVTQRADQTGIIGPTNSKAARRSIIIPSIVSDILGEWQALTGGEEEQLVFGTQSGKPLLLNNIFYRAWKPLMEEAGLMEEVESKSGVKMWPKYSMYCLRHYFASKLIESGQDFKYIQQVMGHSKIEITFNNYGHLIKGNEEAHKAAADGLADSVLKTCGQNVATAA